MTYWPFASPSVFAATKHTATEHLHVSHDGTQPGNEARRDGATPEGSTQSSDADSGEPASDQPPTIDDITERDGKRPGKRRHAHQESAPQLAEDDISGEMIAIRVTRSGQMFATVTRTTLTIWQTKARFFLKTKDIHVNIPQPTVILACVLRSDHSLKTYGPNTNILLRPDSQIFVLQTALGYLITYSLATDPASRVYKTHLTNTGGGGHSRRHSAVGGFNTQRQHDLNAGPGEGNGIKELSLRFRMVIRVDAGIANALALDDELIVATDKPPAVQCIRWAPDSTGSQTSTELLSRMTWLDKNSAIVDMIHDRPMNLSTWITTDGKAFAVQRLPPNTLQEGKPHHSLFKGYGFHNPKSEAEYGVRAAINARFSLLAVGCANGDIHVYTARDYTGNIPLSHKLHPNSTNPGKLTVLTYSPDGYCLFAGYEHGWSMWSVYGMPGATSFSTDRSLSESNREGWLLGILDAFWIGGGAEILLLGNNDNRIFLLDMARSGITGCFSSANVSRSLMQTSSGFMIYRGYDLPDLTTISGDVSLWHHVQVPAHYLVDQWPIRSAVISSDGRYVAIAGKRGLAHYSVISGRWKTFNDPFVENEFTVRGGMCWFQHVLIAAVESQNSHQVC
jgi:RAB6A-GEF complex partner protein 1